MYLIRLSYEPRPGMTGDAAVAAAREFNRYWVGLGMPQMRLLLAPFGQFGTPFVQLDVTVDDLAEAEAALTRLRAQMDPHAETHAPLMVEILRVVDDPPIDGQQVAELYTATAPLTRPDALTPPPADDNDATAAGLKAQDVGSE
jgi:hypothetical protein